MNYKKALLELKKQMEDDLERVKTELKTGEISLSGQKITEDGKSYLSGYRTCLEIYLFNLNTFLTNIKGGR